MDIKKQVGQRIKKLRSIFKLSQEQVAERCGLSNETISRVERGVQGATLDNYSKIARALGVPLHDLFDFGKKQRTIANRQLREVIDLIRPLSEDDIALITRIIIEIVERISREADDTQ